MDLTKLAEDSTKVPSDFGWYGREEMFVTWGFSGISMHRDSSILEQSNYHSMIKFLVDEYGDEFDDNFQEISMGHWAVGHVETLIVKVYQDIKCETCGNLIDFKMARKIGGFEWIDDDDSSICYMSKTIEQYHTPAELTEDNITKYFTLCMEIVTELRDSYPVFDESDFSEREEEALASCIEMYWPNECSSEEGSQYKVISWLYNADISPSYYMDDGTPYFSDDEIYLACFHLGYDNYSDEDDQEFWSEWRKNNPSEVIQRRNKRDEEAGQLKLEV